MIQTKGRSRVLTSVDPPRYEKKVDVKKSHEVREQLVVYDLDIETEARCQIMT